MIQDRLQTDEHVPRFWVPWFQFLSLAGLLEMTGHKMQDICSPEI